MASNNADFEPIWRVTLVKEGQTHTHTTTGRTDIHAAAKMFGIYGYGITIVSVEPVQEGTE